MQRAAGRLRGATATFAPPRSPPSSVSTSAAGYSSISPLHNDQEDDQGDGDDDRGSYDAVELLLDDPSFAQHSHSRRLERVFDLSRGPTGRYDRVLDVVADTNTLLAAYQRLKARPGLKIPMLGSAELPLNWLRLTRESLLAGAYAFQDYRAKNIFRKFAARATQHTLSDRYTFLLANLWAMRTKRAEIYSGRCGFYRKRGRSDPFRGFSLDFFLSYGLYSKYKHRCSTPFPPVGDLIVQEAMDMVLEKIYEPLLSRDVHGYRPSRGCHTLFEEIRSDRWLGVCWLLEFNFENIFAKMDMGKLASILGEEIGDRGFVELILRLFDVKATVAEDVKYSQQTLKRNPELAKNSFEHEELGVRRSVLAPILCHVYLRKIDEEVARMISEQEKVPPDRGRRTVFINVRANPVPANKSLPINMQYVRYLDEFVVGVGGSRAISERVQALVLKFMKTELLLEPDYASYVDISFGSTLFLGMRITAAESTYDPRAEAKKLEKRRRSKFRNMKLREVRERVWSDRMKRLTLQAWIIGLRRVSREIPDLAECKMMVRHKAETMVRDFAIAKLRSGMTRLALEEILNTENAVFFNMSAIGIPDEIAQAHRHLTEMLEKYYKTVLRENRDPPVLPKNKSLRMEMVQNYGALPIRLIAPLDTIMAELRYIGMIRPDSIRPDAVSSFLNAPDESIVSYFAAIAYALLVYYRCSDNYIKVKRIVDYQVRWSAIITLACKHGFTTRKSILEFKRGPQMVKQRGVVASLPSTPGISRFGTMFYDNIQETALEHLMSGSRRPRTK